MEPRPVADASHPFTLDGPRRLGPWVTLNAHTGRGFPETSSRLLEAEKGVWTDLTPTS